MIFPENRLLKKRKDLELRSEMAPKPKRRKIDLPPSWRRGKDLSPVTMKVKDAPATIKAKDAPATVEVKDAPTTMKAQGASATMKAKDASAAMKAKDATPVKISTVPMAQPSSVTIRIQQARNFAVTQAQQDGCTGSFKIFDSPYGNFLVPVVPSRAELAG